MSSRSLEELGRALYEPAIPPPTKQPAPAAASPNKATNRTNEQLAAALYPNGPTTYKKGK